MTNFSDMLSKAKAEYISLSETTKALLFIIQVLEEVGTNVKKPVKVKVDNQAAIFMAKNTTATKRTKHIDVRANFVYKHVNKETGQMEFTAKESHWTRTTGASIIHYYAKKGYTQLIIALRVH